MWCVPETPALAMKKLNVANTDLNLLRVFLTVARCGGFSAAQAELNVSQSTISIHISGLETRLGLKLCQRGRAGFSLTDGGQKVLEACETLFSQLEDFRSTVGSIGGSLVGELVVGVIDSNITHVDFQLPRAIEKFKNRDGDVQIAIHTAPPNYVERMVVEGKAQVGIGFFPLRLPNLQYEEIFTSRIELYCGSGHDLFGRDPSALSDNDILSMPHARRGYVSPDQSPALHRALNVQATASSMEGLAYLVLSNKYHAFLPNHLASRWVEQGLMRSIAPDKYAYTAPFEAILRKSTAHPAIVEAFLEDVRSAAPPVHPKKSMKSSCSKQ